KPESSYYVPPDATFLLSLHLEKILPEIGFNQLINSRSYQERLNSAYSTNPVFTNVFRNPGQAGIHLSKKILFFIDVGDSDKQTYSATLLCLRDESKFQHLVKTTTTKEIRNESHFSSVELGNNNHLAWNKEAAVF